MTRSRRTTRGRLATAAASLALLTLAAAPLQAQRCLGFPGFGGQPLRLGGTLTTGGDVTTVGADLAFGQAAGAVNGSFRQQYRYTGAAIVSNSAWFIGAGFAPLVALWLTAEYGLWAVGLYLLSVSNG